MKKTMTSPTNQHQKNADSLAGFGLSDKPPLVDIAICRGRCNNYSATYAIVPDANADSMRTAQHISDNVIGKYTEVCGITEGALPKQHSFEECPYHLEHLLVGGQGCVPPIREFPVSDILGRTVVFRKTNDGQYVHWVGTVTKVVPQGLIIDRYNVNERGRKTDYKKSIIQPGLLISLWPTFRLVNDDGIEELVRFVDA